MADNKAKFKTTVGGQAVMEGIMMLGPEKWALAVRTPEKTIEVETHEVGAKKVWAKVPFVRGVYNYINTVLMGYNTLMRSAELALSEEELEEDKTAFDRWLEKVFGEKAASAVMAVAAVLGILLALLLFMVLPTFIVGLVDRFLPLGIFKALLEGVLKISFFIIYLALARKAADVKRMFGYHGAEHKTIFCYESGAELTVENIRHQSRFHPRCGTSFLLIVLVVSILLFGFVPWTSTLMRVGFKILLLPVVMSISYEIIRFTGRHNNIVTRAISAPGMWLQRLTTNEPDDSMIEVAIAAVTPVLPQDPGEAKW